MLWHSVELEQDGGLLHVRRLVSQALFELSLKVDHRSTPNLIYSSKDRDFCEKITLFKGSREKTLIVRLKSRLSFVRNN